MVCALLGTGCATSMVHAPPQAPRAQPTQTVVLVHGMFMDPSCWSQWQPYLEAQGYHAIAPAWPGHEGSAAQARQAHPDPALAAVDLPAVVDHYRRIIAELDEPPILVGHSMGGLVVQILLSEGLGSAGVAIDAAPPKGVFTLSHAFIKSNGRVLRGSLDEPLDMDLERFSYVFVNTLPPQEQRRAWEAHARPESRRVGRGSTTDAGKVDFGRRRAPLLLLGGEHDHAVPAVIGRKTFRRYRKAEAITEYRELAGVDHWLIASDRWQEVAELTVQWLAEQGASPPSPGLSPRPSAADPAPR
ncbi:MAG: alpha/beta hydrolase [Myxococcales bacterium]|nr:alpha/beta hydrolase [Myxococcales bacterium]